jgi:hypothetical protein
MVASRFRRPVVSLTTVKQPGLPVELDGEMYETISPVEWGADKALEVRQHLRGIEKFEEKMSADKDEGPTQDDVKQYRFHLRSFATVVLPDAPREKIAQLSDIQLQTLVQVFMQALGEQRRPPSSEQNGTKPTSVPSSPDFATATQESEDGKQ